MKRTIFVVWVVLVSTVCAVRFAFAKNPGGVYPEERRQQQHSVLAQAWNSGLNIDVGLIGTDDPNAITDKSFYQQIVKEAYDNWFKGTAEHIRKAHREQEFSDIYGRLQQGANITFDKAARDQVRVNVVSPERLQKECDNPNAVACVKIGKQSTAGLARDSSARRPVIYVAYADKGVQQDAQKLNEYKTSVTHEAGHTLGFTEQYDHHDRETSDPKRSSSQWDPQSVMNGISGNKVSAGDATTLINQLDAEGLSGTQRKGKEWAALGEGDPDRYKDGKRIGSEQENQIVGEGDGKWSFTPPGGTKRTYEVAKNTKFKSINDIMDAKITVKKRDANGNILEGVDQYGHRVVYDHRQGYESRMFFAGNQLVAVDQKGKDQFGESYVAEVGINGKLETITAEPDSKTGNMIFDYNGEASIECPPEKAHDCASKKLAALKECQASGAKDVVECVKQRTSGQQGQTAQQSAQQQTQGQQKTPQNGKKPVAQQGKKPASTATGTQGTTGVRKSPQQRTSAQQRPAQQRRQATGGSTAARNSGVVGAASTRQASGQYAQKGGNQIIGVAR